MDCLAARRLICWLGCRLVRLQPPEVRGPFDGQGVHSGQCDASPARARERLHRGQRATGLLLGFILGVSGPVLGAGLCGRIAARQASKHHESPPAHRVTVMSLALPVDGSRPGRRRGSGRRRWCDSRPRGHARPDATRRRRRHGRGRAHKRWDAAGRVPPPAPPRRVSYITIECHARIPPTLGES